MNADHDVAARIAAVPGATRRRDAESLVALMGRITGKTPGLWPGSIVGFGEYHYRYKSGREGDAAAVGFAPRAASTTIYLPDGVGAHSERLQRLGAHKTGVGCLYVTDLDRVDLRVLEEILTESYRTVGSGTFGHRARNSADGRET